MIYIEDRLYACLFFVRKIQLRILSAGPAGSYVS